MNKNVIKITESELKQIVAESVNRILTELDFKTYTKAPKYKDKKDTFQIADMDALDKQYDILKDKAQAIQDRWGGKDTSYKDESSHDNFTQSIYNIQSVINNAMKKVEKGLWHDEELSQLNAFCQDYIDAYKELLSKMK